MEEFSLNNINIRINHPQKDFNYLKLTNSLEYLKSKETKIKLSNFFYNLFIDSVTKGNRISYLNEDLIYFNKITNEFKYRGKFNYNNR